MDEDPRAPRERPAQHEEGTSAPPWQIKCQMSPRSGHSTTMTSGLSSTTKAGYTCRVSINQTALYGTPSSIVYRLISHSDMNLCAVAGGTERGFISSTPHAAHSCLCHPLGCTIPRPSCCRIGVDAYILFLCYRGPSADTRSSDANVLPL